jgi:hypothetical protein
MTPEEMSALDDDAFFAYLSALDQRPDAPAEIVTQAWTELQTRRARLEAAMHEEAAASGMTSAQIEEMVQCVRRIFGVREDTL